MTPTGRLSLHQLTALDASPEELVAIAGDLECSHVSLFTFVPELARQHYPLVSRHDVPRLRDALDKAGVALGNVEVFPLETDAMPEAFRASLATGAALGASRATAHVHATDLQTAIARFADFCDLAAGFGLKAGLEFNGFSAVRDCATAGAIVRAAARPNGEVALDMLHLFRSGGTVADVAAVADLVGYAQICDGPLLLPIIARWREAIAERMLPGEGEFPLPQLIAALHDDTLLDVEVPQTAARQAGVSAPERARRAIAATRTLAREPA